MAFAEQDRPLPGPGARQRLLLRGRDGQGSTRRLRLARRARPHGAPPPRSFPVHTPRMPIEPHHACANDLPIQPPPPLNTGCAPRYLGRLSRNSAILLLLCFSFARPVIHPPLLLYISLLFFRSAALGLRLLAEDLWRHLLPEPGRFFTCCNLLARGGSRFFVTSVRGLSPHSQPRTAHSPRNVARQWPAATTPAALLSYVGAVPAARWLPASRLAGPNAVGLTRHRRASSHVATGSAARTSLTPKSIRCATSALAAVL